MTKKRIYRVSEQTQKLLHFSVLKRTPVRLDAILNKIYFNVIIAFICVLKGVTDVFIVK